MHQSQARYTFTIKEMKIAKEVAEQFLEDVSILHHGINMKYEVRRIY
jgi:hypothetical protein